MSPNQLITPTCTSQLPVPLNSETSLNGSAAPAKKITSVMRVTRATSVKIARNCTLVADNRSKIRRSLLFHSIGRNNREAKTVAVTPNQNMQSPFPLPNSASPLSSNRSQDITPPPSIILKRIDYTKSSESSPIAMSSASNTVSFFLLIFSFQLSRFSIGL